MKITEIEFGKHKNYVDENGNVWCAGIFELEAENGAELKINDIYYLSRILTLNFEEQVDWSKVEVDTPMWVKQHKDNEWFECHFSKYEDGKVHGFACGTTSWTTGQSLAYNHAKLATK